MISRTEPLPGCSWPPYLPPHLPCLLQLPPEGHNPHPHQASLGQRSGQAGAVMPTPGFAHWRGSRGLGTPGVVEGRMRVRDPGVGLRTQQHVHPALLCHRAFPNAVAASWNIPPSHSFSEATFIHPPGLSLDSASSPPPGSDPCLLPGIVTTCSPAPSRDLLTPQPLSYRGQFIIAPTLRPAPRAQQIVWLNK